MDDLSQLLINSGIDCFIDNVCLNLVFYEDDLLGYEPADLTVHPPPQNCRGWVHFFHIGV